MKRILENHWTEGRVDAIAWGVTMMVAGLAPGIAHANPEGLSVQSGSAFAATSGNQLNITASHNASLQWQSFNIGSGETTRFIQPSSSSVVWNHILDANPSQIFGRLEANGTVVLVNASGFYFGPNSYVSAAGLIVSTANVHPVESNAGLFWQFSGPPPAASIVNHGHLTTDRGGSLFLISQHIDNRGTLSAPEGRVGLLAGQEVEINSRPDGRGLGATVRVPSGAVDNVGHITADAGTIALRAQVVNQGGLVQANSVREQNGIIELVASDALSLESTSRVTARGDADAVSSAGSVILKSEGTFEDASGSRIDISGGGRGGNGGFVEVSAPTMAAVHSTIDGTAGSGATGGQLLIDPTDIVIGSSGSGSIGSGTVASGSAPSTLNLNVNSSFQGFSQITLQATRNITLAANTVWDLEQSTGLTQAGSLLKLEAGNNITFASGSSLLAGDNWSVTLQAGRSFPTANSVVSGVGNISLSGSASLQAQNGTVSLLAGNNVTVGSGFVRTMQGGHIAAQAVGGSINTGTRSKGFQFVPGGTGYLVDPDLGGISTYAGGNVSLIAGLDVVSLLPAPGGTQSDAGSGAFGAEPGNVSVQAGRDVAGHFVVRKGTGQVDAGRDAGIGSRLLALSLVDGGWTVNAGRDVLLQEVRNPNGIFNNLGATTAPNRHRFDYAATAYTFLNAVNSVQLRGTGLPRYSDAFEEGITPIYPGRLEVTAGAGGISLANDVTLFPSPVGNLKLTTTDGGSLTGTKVGELSQLVVSDSGNTQYRKFGDFGVSDHADTPVHVEIDPVTSQIISVDAEPVRLNIAGDMSSVLLSVPKKAEINVGRDLINSRFEGQNLLETDTTTLHVGRDILNRNEFTTVSLGSAPDFGLFDLVYPAFQGAVSGVQNLFTYNAQTHELTFQGRMTGEQLNALQTLRVRAFDANGFPLFDANGDPVTVAAQFADPVALQALYDNSQNVPLNPDTGYRIGGGGLFDITARNLDLGATVGIVSQGPRGNPGLARLFTHGADIHVSLTGDLDMFSTKIASINGGEIRVTADGAVNVGSRTFNPNDSSARGIFTTDPSDVTVIARGNINVNGSRIAAYDGGNVTVRSLEGNVDAGTGASGVATVEKLYVDPLTRQVLSYAPTIPGSGILATSFPRSLDGVFPESVHTVGDILVETPRGDIIASAGGIVQIPLNGVGDSVGNVTLRAGTKDSQGNVIYAGNIDASGSGVIGGNIRMDASGDIRGVVFARQDLGLIARGNIEAQTVSGGKTDIGAGGDVRGVIVGLGALNVKGDTVAASLLSQNISASGNLSAAQTGFTQGTAAAGTSQSLQSDVVAKVADVAKPSIESDSGQRKNRDLPLLTRTVGRVTVILPSKN